MSEYSQGKYVGEVVSHGFDVVEKKDGTAVPVMRIEFTVIGKADDDGQYQEVENKYDRNLTVWMDEKSIEKSIGYLRKYAGWKGEDLGELDDNVLEGEQIEVALIGKWNGKYDRFAFPTERKSRVGASNSAVAKHLRNKYNALAKKSAPSKPQPQSDSTAGVGDLDGEDDIPF